MGPDSQVIDTIQQRSAIGSLLGLSKVNRINSVILKVLKYDFNKSLIPSKFLLKREMGVRKATVSISLATVGAGLRPTQGLLEVAARGRRGWLS